VERFEDLLHERGIQIVGQYATGSGDMVRLVLRVPEDERDLDVALSLEALVERPEVIMREVEEMIERRREGRRAGNGHGHG